jgi:hypothetical protein
VKAEGDEMTERDDELELVYQDLEACREMSKRHAMTAHLRLEALNALLKAARDAVRYFSGAQDLVVMSQLNWSR